MLVSITNFDKQNLTVDLAEIDISNPLSESNVSVLNLEHAKDLQNNDIKNTLKVKVTNGQLISFYPMSGDENAQKLHYLHLLAHTLEEVQTDAIARNISIEGKTKDQLAKEIIQDECNKNQCLYLINDF